MTIAATKVIENPFDRETNYLDTLKKGEFLEKDGKKFPRLCGLQRLAHSNRGGVKHVLVGDPQFVVGQNSTLAMARIEYHFYDGSIFSGMADASSLAHKEPYSLHLVALSESKAEARALRRAFNISAVSAEEIGSAPIAGVDNGPIEDAQISGINMLRKRKGLNEQEALDLIKSAAGSVRELDAEKGRELMKSLNKVKKKTK